MTWLAAWFDSGFARESTLPTARLLLPDGRVVGVGRQWLPGLFEVGVGLIRDRHYTWRKLAEGGGVVIETVRLEFDIAPHVEELFAAHGVDAVLHHHRELIGGQLFEGVLVRPLGSFPVLLFKLQNFVLLHCRGCGHRLLHAKSGIEKAS